MDHVAAKVQLRMGKLDSAEQFAATAARGWGAGARREALLTSITRAQIHLQAGEPRGIALAQEVVTTVEQLCSKPGARPAGAAGGRARLAAAARTGAPRAASRGQPRVAARAGRL